MQRDHRQSRRRFIKGAGAVGTVALAGCSSGSNDSTTTEGEPTSSTDATTGTGSQSMADKIVFYNAGSLKYDPGTEKNINRFEEETGITVEVNEVPWTNLKTSLITQWRNQSSNVDAFNGPSWWLADFVNADWLEPLDLPSDHVSRFPDSHRELITFDGDVYMAPQLGKWGNFLYDKQYFSEQGVDSPPETWSEIIEKGAQLTSDDTSGFGFTWANKDIFMFKQFLWQAGGQMFTDDNEPAFVEKGTQVFEDLITPLRDQGIIPDGLSSMGEGPIGDSFIAGSFAMVEGWTPLGKRTLDAEGWNEDRLGSALPPQGPENRATFADSNGVSVSAFSKRKDAAKKFAEFMSTPKSAKTDMLVEGNPAVIPSVYDDSEIRDKYPSWLLEDMKYNLKHATSEIYLAQPQVDNHLSNQITPALLGDKDPAEALKAAEQNITQLYQNIGLL